MFVTLVDAPPLIIFVVRFILAEEPKSGSGEPHWFVAGLLVLRLLTLGTVQY